MNNNLAFRLFYAYPLFMLVKKLRNFTNMPVTTKYGKLKLAKYTQQHNPLIGNGKLRTLVKIPGKELLMKKLSNSLNRYIQLTASDEVRDICEPILGKLGITYFLYINSFHDGSRLWLTNNGSWTEHFYQHEYYNISAFEDPKQPYQSGYFLWSTLCGQELFANAKNNFNIDHGITVVNQFKDAHEFVHFGTTRDNPTIINLYLNHLDLLNKFILYFRDKSAPLLKIAKENMISLPQPKRNNSQSEKCFKNADEIKQKLQQNMRRCKYTLSHLYENANLTPREIECINWLKKGKTAADTALILNITKRTVDVHTENAKRKLNCHNAFQLGYKTATIDFYRI